MSTLPPPTINQVPAASLKSMRKSSQPSAIVGGSHPCQHDGCQMIFLTSKDLCNHRRTHQPPVQCPHCQASMNSSHLKRHITRDCKKTPLTGKDSREESKAPSLPPSSNSKFEHVTCVSLLPHLSPSLYGVNFRHNERGVAPSDLMDLDSDGGEIPSPGPVPICIPQSRPVRIAGITSPINDPATTTVVTRLLNSLKQGNTGCRSASG